MDCRRYCGGNRSRLVRIAARGRRFCRFGGENCNAGRQTQKNYPVRGENRASLEKAASPQMIWIHGKGPRAITL